MCKNHKLHTSTGMKPRWTDPATVKLEGEQISLLSVKAELWANMPCKIWSPSFNR